MITTTTKKSGAIKALKHTLLSLSLISSFNLLAQIQVIHAGTSLPVAAKDTLSN